MGAKIVKLINEDSSLEDGSDFDRVRDLEEGEESSSWDSSSSSGVEEVYDSESCSSEYKPSGEDPYFVEKRFIAGSNQYFYNIVKRK
ncbi:hypothetical protein CRE_13297 [Caenorhabditis remanei]|uniref:Uncharacterized protein n=1 Tax=Caenorhabditis remanei TaxID=31234 RepID=E3M8J8_CAERE|nr:hypothetical protein CRE_13297 [Caenorhabditis remanei]